ncbi:hypothetical protein EVAR_50227_1 [Eumeta japonica]|uniref:Uncharacterized protein n=1 Tax=Eumeta variegata TaxID=151549 RepID=A0A4C2A8Y7_EUMVA|nr:hypothetical protein EVAR_50227_1 [Eumeta japonica]
MYRGTPRPLWGVKARAGINERRPSGELRYTGCTVSLRLRRRALAVPWLLVVYAHQLKYGDDVRRGGEARSKALVPSAARGATAVWSCSRPTLVSKHKKNYGKSVLLRSWLFPA